MRTDDEPKNDGERTEDWIAVSEDDEPDVPVKKPRNKKKLALLLSILAAGVAALVVGGIFAYHAIMNMQLLNKNHVYTPSEIRSTEEQAAKSVNILFCGIDYEEGTSRGHLTDLQMIVNIDVKEKKVRMLQIPRDTYIGLDEGIWTGKINGIYGRAETETRKNGIVGLAQYIHDAFKLNIDFYATVTMDTFKDVVDAIGGVEIYVPLDMTQDGITIPKGRQTLNGEQAELFVRKRKNLGDDREAFNKYYDNGSGDMGRVKMQRLFIAALVKKFKSLSFLKAYQTVLSVMDYIESDMAVKDIATYGKIAYNIDMEDMEIDVLPGEETVVSVDNPTYPTQSVYTLHKQETADLLNEKFRNHRKQVPAEELTIEEIAHSTTRYDNTVDDLNSLLEEGVVPGQDKSVQDDVSSDDETSSDDDDVSSAARD